MIEGFKSQHQHESTERSLGFETLGAKVEAHPYQRDAYVLSFHAEGAITTVGIVFNDYSGADLVITGMTTLPPDRTGEGLGSAAIQNLLKWAKSNNLKDIRAVQVQEPSERFWEKNGFKIMDEPNPTRDFMYIAPQE